MRKGTLTVTAQKGATYTVSCSCGHVFKTYHSRWVNYTGVGCGKCHKANNARGKNNPRYRHGGNLQHKPEYRSWLSMKFRCYNPKYRAYSRYGGRGITVCERWLGKDGFINFLHDMGKRPSLKHTLDRINNDGNYEPDNCRWADDKTQKSNTSQVLMIEINGVSHHLSEWCRIYDIKLSSAYNRILKGWSYEKAFSTPVNPTGVNFNNPRWKKSQKVQ